MGFLRKVHDVTLRYKVCRRSCKIRRNLNIESILRIEISVTLVRPCDQTTTGKIGVASPAAYTHGKAVQRSTKHQMAWVI